MGYTPSGAQPLATAGTQTDLIVFKVKVLKRIEPFKICTHRPSLSPKGEKSRNTVGVTEVAPQGISYLMFFPYTEDKAKLALPDPFYPPLI